MNNRKNEELPKNEGNINGQEKDIVGPLRNLIETDDPDSRRQFLAKLIERFTDLRTLDIVTAKGNYTVNIQDGTNIFDALPDSIKIFAKTHLEIDGDTLNIIPYESPDDRAFKELLEFHEKAVISAKEQWMNRIQTYHEFINTVLSLLTRRLNIPLERVKK